MRHPTTRKSDIRRCRRREREKYEGFGVNFPKIEQFWLEQKVYTSCWKRPSVNPHSNSYFRLPPNEIWERSNSTSPRQKCVRGRWCEGVGGGGSKSIFDPPKPTSTPSPSLRGWGHCRTKCTRAEEKQTSWKSCQKTHFWGALPSSKVNKSHASAEGASDKNQIFRHQNPLKNTHLAPPPDLTKGWQTEPVFLTPKTKSGRIRIRTPQTKMSRVKSIFDSIPRSNSPLPPKGGGWAL